MVKKEFLLIILAAIWTFFYCGREPLGPSTTIIKISVDWRAGDTITPGMIDSIRIIVTDSSSEWSATFPFSAHQGTISNVPRNAFVIVTVEGIRNTDKIVFLGVDTVKNASGDMTITVPAGLVHPRLPPIVTFTSPSSDTTVDSGTTSIVISGTVNDTGMAGIDSLIVNKGDSTGSMNSGRTAFSLTYPVTKDIDTVIVTAWSMGEAGSDTVRIFRRTRAVVQQEVMKLIHGGMFTMGSSDSLDYDASPPHQVIISTFYMESTEVTQAQYLAIMDTNPSFFNDASNLPVDQVTWFDAVRYCVKRSSGEGLQACYDTMAWTCDPAQNGYRLPTEAEWEYACRAGTITPYFWGDTLDPNYCWFAGNSGDSTHLVATRRPNAWGLYDMSGNVWEWCNDWYGDYASGNQTNPAGPSSSLFGSRVLRGGSFGDDTVYQRSAYRIPAPPDKVFNGFGFRCVRR